VASGKERHWFAAGSDGLLVSTAAISSAEEVTEARQLADGEPEAGKLN